MNSVKNKTIVVFKNRALGDAIISLGAIQYLKKMLPDYHLIFGVPDWVYPLFSELNTAADEIIPINLKNINGWLDTYTQIKSRNPQMIIELFQSGRGKKFGEFYQLINQCIYFGNNHHLDDGTYKKANIQRDIDGISGHLNLNSDSFLNFCPSVNLKSESPKKNEIIFGIVATRETKLWPIEYFHQLAVLIQKNFPEYKIIIPVSKNSLDQNLKQNFLRIGILPNVEFIEKSLAELPKSISGAQLYIGNDTGLKHLSIALDIKSLSFFGPEPPIEWHPYDQKVHPYFYLEPLECRTRSAHFCGLSTCDSMICLNGFKAESVFEQVKSLLGE